MERFRSESDTGDQLIRQRLVGFRIVLFRDQLAAGGGGSDGGPVAHVGDRLALADGVGEVGADPLGHSSDALDV